MISEKRQAFLDGTYTVVNHVRMYLNKIEEKKHLNAFVHVYSDEAIERATQLDKKRAEGKTLGSLFGVVVGLKDNINYKDHPLTCGSRILSGYNATYNAHVVQRLLEEDAIILGHLNMDEFAMGSSNETSAHGNVLNPIDESRVPGGSSGGSAVAVAAELVDIALGSDTGGSIRQPAAFTGTIGMKPTYGLISRNGLVAFGSSLDQIGPFARTTADIAESLNVLISHDEKDSTSIQKEAVDYKSYLGKDISGLTIGVPDELLKEGLSEDIQRKVNELKAFLNSHGAQIVPISLNHIKYSIAVYYIIATAEASANLQRFDGVRYGLRETGDDGLDEMYKATRNAGFGAEVKRRIALGTFVLSHGYFDAYYRKAQKVRRLIKDDYDAAFKSCDLVMMPSTPTTAFKFGEFADDPLAMYLADIFTASANLTGIPGISIPVGNDSENLPIGMQFLAPQFKEGVLIQVSDFIETHLTK